MARTWHAMNRRRARRRDTGAFCRTLLQDVQSGKLSERLAEGFRQMNEVWARLAQRMREANSAIDAAKTALVQLPKTYTDRDGPEGG